METLKAELYKLCVKIVEQKIIYLKDNIKKVQESANSDTKSSMGDKYETGRAMAQLEIEKSMVQLSEAQAQLNILSRISPDIISDKVANGSLVICSNGRYYISVSAGLLKAGNESYFAVSGQSPIGQKIMGLKKGDAFEMNGTKILISELF